MSHTHEGETTADIFTKLSAVGEVCASFASGTIWVGEAVDTIFGLKDAGYGLSWYGMGVGMGISLLTAVGSAYSHYILNTNNQSTDEHQHEAAYSSLSQAEDIANLTQAQIDGASEIKEGASAKLRPLQMLALAGDFISDTGDKAGPVTSVFKIATKDHHTPFWAKISVLVGATLFGAASSVADVRSCKNSMKEINQKEAERNMRACPV